MKKILFKAAKLTGFTVSGLFVAFFIYANLEPAPLHAYAKPIEMTIFKVSGLTDPEQANTARDRISQLAGVTACAANPLSEMVSITFDPEQASTASLRKMVQSITRRTVQTAVFTSDEPAGPQCPVPHEYIQAFEKAKYALCLR